MTKSDLSPSITADFGDYYVLWFQYTNTYSIVDTAFQSALTAYIASDTLVQFTTHFKALSSSEVQQLARSLQAYLEDCNAQEAPLTAPDIPFTASNRSLCWQYQINGMAFEAYFDSATTEQMLHPALAHLEMDYGDQPQHTYDVYVESGDLHLFENQQLLQKVPQQDFHFIQGKFKMALFNLLHQKEENDWIGTLHASSITDGDSAIAFIGNSGSGKSTLCSLLVAHGFELLADDISPLALENSHIYHNPAAISIKQKAFEVLAPLFPEIESLPEVQFNPNKGIMKYLPCPSPKHPHYPCKAMVLVNYESDAATQLHPLSVKAVLETIIPDSWLYHDQMHAQAFLDWLASIKFYKLTYRDTQEMIDTVRKLFKS